MFARESRILEFESLETTREVSRDIRDCDVPLFVDMELNVTESFRLGVIILIILFIDSLLIVDFDLLLLRPSRVRLSFPFLLSMTLLCSLLLRVGFSFV